MADAQQNGVAGVPDFFLPLAVAPGAHLLVYPVGGTAQRQLAQGDQITFAEEVFDGAFGLAANVHLALIQALAQIVRRQIHQNDIIGGVKEGVGDGFAYLHAGNTADHIIEAFKMLDVDGGEDVDTGFEQFFDVLPAFRVARTRRVAMRQFVHQDQRRAAGQRGIKVKLMDVASAMGNALLREGAKPLQHGGGIFAAVGFRHADQNIQPLSAQPLRFRQHSPGLTHPGAGAEKHLQLAAMRRSGLLQQTVGVRTQRLVTH